MDAHAEPSGADRESTMPIRVLLAEDNPVVARIAVCQLERLGCRVTTVDNGRLAVDAVRDGDFDVVIMDFHMPVLDGVAATTQIRRLSGPGGRVPVIALTADLRDEVAAECRAAGMQHTLIKPVRRDALRSALDAVLDGR
jgi:CheY-like chemotaxis protein